MLRALRRHLTRTSATPTAADALVYATQAVRAADRALVDAIDWMRPPTGPAGPHQSAEFARLEAAIAAARAALKGIVQ